MGNHKANPFARGSLTPATQCLDLFGREIGPGDLVIAPTMTAPMLRVVAVKPDLRPHQGPPQVVVTVQMTQQIALPAGVPQSVFLQVMAAPQKPEGEVVAPPDGPVVKLTDADAPVPPATDSGHTE